jgi:hypothetical protein
MFKSKVTKNYVNTCFLLVPPNLWTGNTVKNEYFQSKLTKNIVKQLFFGGSTKSVDPKPCEKLVLSIKSYPKPCKNMFCQVSRSFWKEKATDMSMVSVQELGETC